MKSRLLGKSQCLETPGRGSCNCGIWWLPWGSTSLANLRASELARSMLAGVTARMRVLSRLMNCKIISLIWYSMSGGWSPTGTLVMPGRSMRVRFNTGKETKGQNHQSQGRGGIHIPFSHSAHFPKCQGGQASGVLLLQLGHPFFFN